MGKIPYENAANPMTYRTRSGKQFIVIATAPALIMRLWLSRSVP